MNRLGLYSSELHGNLKLFFLTASICFTVCRPTAFRVLCYSQYCVTCIQVQHKLIYFFLRKKMLPGRYLYTVLYWAASFLNINALLVLRATVVLCALWSNFCVFFFGQNSPSKSAHYRLSASSLRFRSQFAPYRSPELPYAPLGSGFAHLCSFFIPGCSPELLSVRLCSAGTSSTWNLENHLKSFSTIFEICLVFFSVFHLSNNLPILLSNTLY
jgi:hypothetical protein